MNRSGQTARLKREREMIGRSASHLQCFLT
jgi:hypothetical protein